MGTAFPKEGDGSPPGSARARLLGPRITDDLASLQAQLTRRIVGAVEGNVDAGAAITIWVEGRRPAVARAEQLMGELRSVETPTLAMLVVANRALRAMAA